MRKVIIVSITLFLLLLPILANSIPSKKVIKVAILRQKWDPLDVTIGDSVSNNFHKLLLKEAEARYDVKFKIYEFWDDWNGGDVQNDSLIKKHIDVAIAPGGFGFWCTPEKYRKEIKKFVRNGGGFYGICGDSIFGSIGIKYMNNKYADIGSKLLGFKGLTPMLCLVNVYSDGSVFVEYIKKSILMMRMDMIRFLLELPTSRAPIYIVPSSLDIQKPYFNQKINVMLGAPPMVDGSAIRKLYMPKVYTIAVLKGYDKPYSEDIEGKKAIVASRYGKGRVILSAVHPELTIANSKAHDIYARNVLWLARVIN